MYTGGRKLRRRLASTFYKNWIMTLYENPKPSQAWVEGGRVEEGDSRPSKYWFGLASIGYIRFYCVGFSSFYSICFTQMLFKVVAKPMIIKTTLINNKQHIVKMVNKQTNVGKAWRVSPM